MMKNGSIRYFTYYFKPMIKFYDLKVQTAARVLFVLMLAAAFGLMLLVQPLLVDMSVYQQQLANEYGEIISSGPLSYPQVMDQISQIIASEKYGQYVMVLLKIVGLLLIRQVFLMVLSFFYLGAYMVDLETQTPHIKQYFSKFLKALPRYIGFNIIFYLCAALLLGACMLVAALAASILPILYPLVSVIWFVVQVLFVFKDTALLDTRVGVIKNFRVSWKLSAGNRLMIARNILFIEILNLVISMAGVDSNVRLTLFIFSFLEIIVLLIRQRLIARMYFSRTRIEREVSAED